MLVVCVTRFMDLATGEVKNVGDKFEVTEERLAEINGTKYGKLVEPAVEEKPKRTRRARTVKE